MPETTSNEPRFNGHFRTPSWTSEQEDFARRLRSQPGAALGHLRNLALSRKPGPMKPDHPFVRAAEVLAERISEPNTEKRDSRIPLSTFTVEEFGIEFWRACLSNEMLLVLVDCFTDPYLPEHPERYFDSILASLLGLLYIWIHVRQPSSKPSYPRPSRFQISHFLGAFVSVEDVWVSLWDEKDRLFVVGSVERSLWRIVTIERLCAAVHQITKPDFLEIYVTDYASRLGHVALYAWTLLHPGTTLAPLCKESGIPWTTHQALSVFLTIIGMKEEYGDEGIGAYATDLVESVGPDAIIRAFQGALADEKLMKGSALFALLETAECVIRSGDDRIGEACATYPLMTPLYESLARYLDAQYEKDPQARGRQDRVINILIANKLAPVMELFGRGLARRTISPGLVPARTTWCLFGYMLDTVMDLVELKIGAQDNQRNSLLEKFRVAFARVIDVWCDGIDDSKWNTERGLPSTTVASLRSEARDFWYPTLRQMRKAGLMTAPLPGCSNIVKSWVKFGKALGLDEDKDRDEYHMVRTQYWCAWHECEHHADTPSPRRLKKCARCKGACYCSAACRKSDWLHGHRESCLPQPAGAQTLDKGAESVD
ncbi:unnamed protein product [Peniophora sp. CBMAI 1063]|nr:unnamed protein product [Peniophora sp. CBMAI 1063]